MDLESNIIKFFAGEEVTYILSSTETSTFIKVAIRDDKIYIQKKQHGLIPIEYSTNDDTFI